MSGIRRFLKKKSGSKLSLNREDGDNGSNVGASLTHSHSTNSVNLETSVDSFNGYALKEKDLSKICKAAWTGDLEKLKSVAANKKKVNWDATDKEKRSALHLACAQGFDDIVEYILAHGANVNLSDSEGKTPLMKACENGNADIVERLLNAGAETNVLDVNKVTAMHISAAQGNTTVGSMLADKDAKLDSKDKNEVTPLHLSSALGNHDFVDFLLSEYVGVECFDNQGRTPLMAACIDGHQDVVRLLLKNGADVSATDKNKQTAHQLAESYGNPSICTILDEFSHNKQQRASTSPTSPSKEAMFSPVAKSLNQMFSPTGSATSRGSVVSGASAVMHNPIFGGPAVNIKGPQISLNYATVPVSSAPSVISAQEKSEESVSEGLGDNSWADSDPESITENENKKKVSLNFSALLKQAPRVGNGGSSKENTDTAVVEPKNEKTDGLLEKTSENAQASPVKKNEMARMNPTAEPASPVSQQQQQLPDFSGDISSGDDDGSDFSEPPLSDLNASLDGPPVVAIKSPTRTPQLETISSPQKTQGDPNNNTVVVNPPLPPALDDWNDSSSEEDSQPAAGKSKKELVTKLSLTALLPNFLPQSTTASKPSAQTTASKPSTQTSGEVQSSLGLSDDGEDESESDWDSQLSDVLPDNDQSMDAAAGNVEHYEATSSDEEEHVTGAPDNYLGGSSLDFGADEPDNRLDDEPDNRLGSEPDDDSDDDIERMLTESQQNLQQSKAAVSATMQRQASTNSTLASARKSNLAALGILDSSSEDEGDNKEDVKAELLETVEQEVSLVKSPVATSSGRKESARLDQFERDQQAKEDALAREIAAELQKEIDIGNEEEGENVNDKSDVDFNLPLKDHHESSAEPPPQFGDLNVNKQQESLVQNNSLSLNLDDDDDISETTRDEDVDFGSDDDFSLSDSTPNKPNAYEPSPRMSTGTATSSAYNFPLQEEGSKNAESEISPTVVDEPALEMNVAAESFSQNIEEDVDSNKVKSPAVKKEPLNKVLPPLNSEKLAPLKNNQSASPLTGNVKSEEEIRKEIQREFKNDIEALKTQNKEWAEILRQKEAQDEQRRKEIEALNRSIKEERQDFEEVKQQMLTDCECMEKEFADREQELERQLEAQGDAIEEVAEERRRELMREFEREKSEIISKYEEERIKMELDLETQGSHCQYEMRTLEEKFELERKDFLQIIAEKDKRLHQISETEIDDEREDRDLNLNELQKELANKDQWIKEKEAEFSLILKEEQGFYKEEENRFKSELMKKAEELAARDETIVNLEDDLESLRTINQNLQQRLEESEQLRESKRLQSVVELTESQAKFETQLGEIASQHAQDLNSKIEELRAQHERELREKEKEYMERLSEQIHQENSKAEEGLMRLKLKQSLDDEESKMKLKMREEERRMKEELDKQRDSRLKQILDESREKQHEYETKFKEKTEKLEADLQSKEREIEALENRRAQLEREEESHKSDDVRKLEDTYEEMYHQRLAELEREYEEKQNSLENMLLKQHPRPGAANQASSPIKQNSDYADYQRRSSITDHLEHSRLYRDAARNKIASLRGQENDSFMNDSYRREFGSSPLQDASTPVNKDYEERGDWNSKELRETQEKLKISKDKNMHLERKIKDLQFEIEELQKLVSAVNDSQSTHERGRIDTDHELRSINHRFEEEQEIRLMNEKLCKQLKEQLNKADAKIQGLTEERQRLENESRDACAQVKQRDDVIEKFELDRNEMLAMLEGEKKSRGIQEELYREQLCQHELILREAQRTSAQHKHAVDKITALDETRKMAESSSDALCMQLNAAQGELSRTQAQLEELKGRSKIELTSLQNNFNAQHEKLTTAEKELHSLQLRFAEEKSILSTGNEKLQITLDNELKNKEALSDKVSSLSARLERCKEDLEKNVTEKQQVNLEMLTFKQKSRFEQLQLEKELDITKERLKNAEERLQSSDSNLKALKQEFEGASLRQRKDEVHRTAEEVRREQMQILEEKLKNEQVMTAKLQRKAESDQERLASLQTLNSEMKEELTSTERRLQDIEKYAHSNKDDMNSVIMKLKDEFQKERSELVIAKEQLTFRIEKLDTINQEHVAETRVKTKKIDSLTKELNDCSMELTTTNDLLAEMKKDQSLNEAKNKELNSLVERLKDENDTLTQRVTGNQAKIEELSGTLERTLQLNDEATQKIQKTASQVDHAKNTNLELESGLESLRRQNVGMELDLRDEKNKAITLTQQLHDANNAHESLEKLLAKAKGNNATLEERLYSEALNRTEREREVEEHKGLWESEVRSRSKLGLKIMAMEKEIAELKKIHVEDQRKVRKAMESKKISEAKIEMFDKRSNQHEKEVTALKQKLKQYQRKLKELENGDSRIPSIYAEFDQERKTMFSNVANLRNQLNQLSERLKQEQELRESIDKAHRDQIKDVTDLKSKEKVLGYEKERLEKALRTAQDELESLMKHYEKNYIPRAEIEEYKRQMETKASLEVNQKLQEVNLHLEEQSLAREAFDKIRSEKEGKNRKELEETIASLKNEVTSLRTGVHEGMARRDTHEQHAKRFRELFEQERTQNDLLVEKLDKTNHRLSLEKSRQNALLEETLKDNLKINKKLFTETPQRLRDTTLHASHLTSPRLWSTPLSPTTRPSSVMTSSSPDRDYLNIVRKRNLLS